MALAMSGAHGPDYSGRCAFRQRKRRAVAICSAGANCGMRLVRPVSNYTTRLRDMLEHLALEGATAPRVVVLTAGT
jgi:uncharacterized circularly permuted ATP-grasp superfamily protein